MLKKQRFETELAGRKLWLETGRLANQANASCLVGYGDTVVLATAVMAKEARGGIDFFPLTVEVQERMYAAGKIKGSRFVKREGRPTDNAVLDGRMIDRGIRPLFNQQLRNEVQLAITVLSCDNENLPDVLAITAAAAALHISDIPWQGPLAGVCVGLVEGKLVFNPTIEQLAKSDLKLVFSAAKSGVMMIDAEGREIKEELMAEALALGLRQAQPLLEFLEKIRQEVGLEKQAENKLIEAATVAGETSLADKQAAWEEAKKFFTPQLEKYLFNQPRGTKRERKEIAKKMLEDFLAQLPTEKQQPEIIDYIKGNFEGYLEEAASQAILAKDLRIDGRKLDQIRPLSVEVGVLPRTHGSAIFSRGETQILSVVTLGAPGDVQILDEMTEDDTKKHYIHFYNCPPYSFGETGAFRGAGRREIGHGALAEKALLPVLPDKESFPYTIMVVSEVMGSNGSSSMASTCGSTLALLDAGVPLKKPVAGIALGLASQGDSYKILTDLQDMEDGEGGMDFKVTGTVDGITAIQMDTKTPGLGLALCQEALSRAKTARLEILEQMAAVIAEPRKELSPYAPRIVSFRIDPEKIRSVIGSGGKIINEIIDKCGVEIDIEDDGLVAITGLKAEGVAKAVKWVEDIVKDVEPGEIYNGKVTRLMEFGAFVEILPGKEGLVHISEFSNQRVDKIADVAQVGQELKVKVVEIDSQGRINLSVKQADPSYDPKTDPRNGQGRNSNGGFGNGRPPRRDNNHRRPMGGFGRR